jgi:hypothetical protein
MVVNERLFAESARLLQVRLLLFFSEMQLVMNRFAMMNLMRASARTL